MKKWFANLKVAHKLVLMTIFFLLPDSIMLYMVLWGINDNIQFAQQEVRGNAYLRPLVRILHELPEHQRLAAAASRGDRIATTNLQQVDTAITRSIDELVGIDRRYGQILQFTPQALSARGRAQASVANLSQNWLALRSRSTGSDAGGTVACQQMVATVRQMITHAGDMSNLILDPDLDSYYLMDSVVLSIPQDQEQLARLIQASASPISASEAATDAANLSMQLDHISNCINTALREPSEYYGLPPQLKKVLLPALGSYSSAMRRFIGQIQSGGTSARAAGGLVASGLQARDSEMALWEAASNQLDFLLLSRIEYFEQRRMMSLLIAAFAVLSACLLTTGINRSINVPLKRQADELRMLNAALNAEVNEKLAARAALVEASHRAGMAEIATGVLHNVGNVLNSVNTSATVIREKLDNSRVPILGRAAAMLKDHEQDVGRFLASDPKGKQIPQLLCQLADVMAGDRNQVVDEITQLTRNIEHIRQIVQSQQTFAKGGCQDEEFDLTELLEDSLRMTGLARGVHGIELVRDFHPCPHARICRHKVLQIVVNLISNARKAVIESGYPKKKIIVSLEPVKAAGPGRVRIRVTDNGVGIPAENLERIFQHGFTTRKDGHGFGLHTALLDTQAMGGSMTVCSPGPGLGAIFLLELPLEPIPQSDEQLEPLTF